MSTTPHHPTPWPTVLHGLRRLRASAPGSLVPRVLVEVGLADAYATVASSIGPVFVAWNRLGVSAVEPAGDPAAFEAGFRARHGRPVGAVAAPPAGLAAAIEAGLHGRRRRSLHFDLRGLTEFERAVLAKTAEIPAGQVRPYAWVASEIGRPRAVRAVGSALAGNPVPLLIPCHRVVYSDGRVGMYALGPENKRAALTAEGVDPDELERLARAGVRVVGSDTTRVFCFPTCRHARRVTPAHRVEFGSPRAAAAAGYRPCRHCRPAAA
jgi:O-6-methylguanine DNA methyltransferase